MDRDQGVMRRRVSRFALAVIATTALGLASCRDADVPWGPGVTGLSNDDVAPPPADDPTNNSDDQSGQVDDPDAKFHLTVTPTTASIQKNLLDPYCVSCHAGAAAKAKLDLTNLEKTIQPPPGGHDHNGYHGHLIVPGRPKDSMLFLVMHTMNKKQCMPPPASGMPRVEDAQIAAVVSWISAMPAAPDDEPGDGEPGTDEPGADPDEPGTGGSDEPGTGGSDEPGT